MILNLLKMICSRHKLRGEKVMTFNLSPPYYKVLKGFAYDGEVIPLVCEGWIKIKDYYYLELETTQGFLLVTKLTYTLK